MSPNIRVLIVDDHAILRDGIRSLLERQANIEMVGEASNGREAIYRVGELQPDIVLMDIAMPEMNGLEATRQITEKYPHVRILILTQHDNREFITPILQAGASGYILKKSGGRELVNAIHEVYEQGAFLESTITRQLLDDYSRLDKNDAFPDVHLTHRQKEVLHLLIAGKSNKEIAFSLSISPKTVSVHRSNIMKKLDVHNNFVYIPASDFQMGSDPSRDRQADQDEQPQHILSVSEFFIMRHTVTNAQYRQFIEATDHQTPLFWKKDEFPHDKTNHPVVGVSYRDAIAYCRWAGEQIGLPLRLPTETEWEKAARGPDGRIFPWGDRWEAGRGNTREAKLKGTTPVGYFSPAGDSPYGLTDLGGNVQNWLSNLYGPYPYDPEDGRELLVNNLDHDQLLPRLWNTGCTSVPSSLEAAKNKSVIRGSSWRETKYQSRCAYRSWAAPLHRSDDTGFRCCYEPRF